jgi:hypothetical protein
MSKEKKATDYDDLMYTRRPAGPMGKHGGGGVRRNSASTNSTASYKEYEKEKHDMSIGTMNTASGKKVTLPIDHNDLERLNIGESSSLNPGGGPPAESTQIDNNENSFNQADNVNIVNNNKNNSKDPGSVSGFLQKIFKKKKNPSIDINDLIKPSPILPMVKFDEEGDFFKEPLESKLQRTIIFLNECH